MTADTGDLCDDDQLADILAVSRQGPDAGIAAIDSSLATYPRDYRLHFLKGSLLIGQKRFIGAHQALSAAVAIAPDFHIARFQLGFFELTSGEPDAARATWEPLKALPAGHWLRSFVDGLEHLAADRFGDCIRCLQDGIAKNQENLPLNDDMALIIQKSEELLSQSARTGTQQAGSEQGSEDVSATSFLLASQLRKH